MNKEFEKALNNFCDNFNLEEYEPKGHFHQLKEYINVGKDGLNIFGNLTDRECEFSFQNPKITDRVEFKTYRPSGCYAGEYDFLLDYYVHGILPKYRIENDRIIPYLHITLSKEGE